MVTVKYKEVPMSHVAGVCRPVREVEDFADFWRDCHADGTIARIQGMRAAPGPVTRAWTLGVSRVENAPENRTFDFYIAGEVGPDAPLPAGFTRFPIPACAWAICRGEGEIMDALYAAEIHAFGTLLKNGRRRHASAPELEAYPAEGGVAFWLPVEALARP